MADKENIKFLQQLQAMQESLNNAISSSLDLNTKILIQEEAIANKKRIQAEQERLTLESKEGIIKLTKEEEKELDNILNKEKSITKTIDVQRQKRERILNILKTTGGFIKEGWKFLQAQDKVIKSTILSLGMSGQKAELMRLSFEQSASAAAMLGASIEDLGAIQAGFAEETGRARALTADMLMDIVEMGKGTGLGVEQATRLAAQFEIMGVDVKKTMEFTQGVVDTSERMGVNTTKVLRNINDNFKRLNTYTFKQGVKGIAEMAIYAEKFKLSIDSALNAAEISRTLEGAINLTAQLQVMGGEFAKTDPFEMLFLSRNDPAKFAEKIGDMTKGIVTFRKNSEGAFEKFISPADRDRLANVAKSLGISVEELTQTAQRQAEIQRMRQQMQGMGLSKEQQELLEGAAMFDSKSGKFQVQIAGHMREITTLNNTQIKKYAEERKTLEQRAEQALTFDEAFKNTINALKASLLPLLQHVNVFLEEVRPLFKWLGEQGLASSAAMLMGAGLLWKGVTRGLAQAASNWVDTGSLSGGKTRKAGGLRTFLGGGKKVAGGAGKAGGFAGGAGIGAAALGMGAGVGIAAVGISKLADAMSKLDPEQAEALQNIAMTLAITFPAAAIGIAAVGGVAKAGALGLLALGATIALIGGGIGLAAWGIGEMAKGLSELVATGAEAGDSIFTLAAGMAMMSGSLLLFTAGGLGMLVFGNTMRMIAKRAGDIERVGYAFEQINAVMSGSKEDWIAIQNAVDSISKSNIRGGGMFSELAELLKKPIKVEFSDNKVALNNDITLNIDGQKFMNKSYDVNLAVQRAESARNGKSANKE